MCPPPGSAFNESAFFVQNRVLQASCRRLVPWAAGKPCSISKVPQAGGFTSRMGPRQALEPCGPWSRCRQAGPCEPTRKRLSPSPPALRVAGPATCRAATRPWLSLHGVLPGCVRVLLPLCPFRVREELWTGEKRTPGAHTEGLRPTQGSRALQGGGARGSGGWWMETSRKHTAGWAGRLQARQSHGQGQGDQDSGKECDWRLVEDGGLDQDTGSSWAEAALDGPNLTLPRPCFLLRTAAGPGSQDFRLTGAASHPTQERAPLPLKYPWGGPLQVRAGLSQGLLSREAMPLSWARGTQRSVALAWSQGEAGAHLCRAVLPARSGFH